MLVEVALFDVVVVGVAPVDAVPVCELPPPEPPPEADTTSMDDEADACVAVSVAVTWNVPVGVPPPLEGNVYDAAPDESAETGPKLSVTPLGRTTVIAIEAPGLKPEADIVT